MGERAQSRAQQWDMGGKQAGGARKLADCAKLVHVSCASKMPAPRDGKKRHEGKEAKGGRPRAHLKVGPHVAEAAGAAKACTVERLEAEERRLSKLHLAGCGMQAHAPVAAAG